MAKTHPRQHKSNDDVDPLHGGRVAVPRSRGAMSGILLVLLGAWGALIPFIGPLFSFGFSPDKSWQWTAARGWLEVLPGIVVVVGGLLLLVSANRITASLGGWLAVAGGAWFVLGNNFADLLHIGSPGAPTGSSKSLQVIEFLTYFDGLGVLIVILAALGLGRLSVRSVRDVRTAQKREEEAAAEREHRDAEIEANRQEDMRREERERLVREQVARERADAPQAPTERTVRSDSSFETESPASPNGATAVNQSEK